MELGERALVLRLVHLRVDERHDLAVRDERVVVREQLDDLAVHLRADLHLLDRRHRPGGLHRLDDVRPGDGREPVLGTLFLRELLAAACNRRQHGRQKEFHRSIPP